MKRPRPAPSQHHPGPGGRAEARRGPPSRVGSEPQPCRVPHVILGGGNCVHGGGNCVPGPAPAHLPSAGPSAARSRRWTASRPPWPAARAAARPASRRTRRPRRSPSSPGRCCTSAEPLASLGTLRGDRGTGRLPWQRGRRRRLLSGSGMLGTPGGPTAPDAIRSKGVVHIMDLHVY